MGCGSSRPTPTAGDGPASSSSKTALTSTESKLTEMGADDYILKVTIEQAKDLLAADIGGTSDPYCTLSFADRTYKTLVRYKTLNPHWGQRLALILPVSQSNNGASFLLMDKDRVGSDLLGSVEISSLKQYLDGQLHDVWLDVTKVKDGETIPAGQLNIKFEAKTKEQIKLKFWERMIADFDTDQTGDLSKPELGLLLEGIGMSVTDEELEKKFKELDKNDDHRISASELAEVFKDQTFLIAESRGRGGNTDRKEENEAEALWDIANCAETAENDSFVIGGFLTEASASKNFRSRIFGSAEEHYKMDAHSGNIYVLNRATKIVEEEKIPGFVRLSLKALYTPNIKIEDKKVVLKTLKVLSVRQGKAYDKKSSAKHIRSFVDFHQIKMEDFLLPIEKYETFNEFFYRKLKPEARPIAEPDNPSVAVSGADCRSVCFPEISDITKLWVKGKEFTIEALLKDKDLASHYTATGSAIIFRLSPQDYHRFHHPVNGKIVSMKEIDGELFTVNPIAVRGECDVFTENKRHITIIESPEFGRVCFLSVGATMVGSIRFTDSVGQEVTKGSEHGYFAFGGSTVICLFEPGKIKFDSDLVENSQKPIETLIRVGERIGIAPPSDGRL